LATHDFFSLLNITGIYSQIIYTSNTNNFPHRKDYLRTLATELIPEQTKRKIFIKSVPNSIKNRFREITGITEESAKPPPNSEVWLLWLEKKSQDKNNL